jgi:hypothetical protein
LAIQGDRRYLIEKRIDSVFVLLWPPGCWWNHGLNGYLAGRCFFAPSLDPFHELRDFAMHCFGPEAGPALAAYYEQWAREIGLSYHVRGGAQDADVGMLAGQRVKWLQPAARAARASVLYSYRVSKVEKLHTIAQRMAEAGRQDEQTTRLRNERRFDAAKNRLVQLRATTGELLKLAHAFADLNQGLIDSKVFDAFTAPALKGQIEGQTKALAELGEEGER